MLFTIRWTKDTKSGILSSHVEKRSERKVGSRTGSLPISGRNRPNRISRAVSRGGERKMCGFEFLARKLFVQLGCARLNATKVAVEIHRGWYGPQTYSREYVECGGRGIFLIPLGWVSPEPRWGKGQLREVGAAKEILERAGFSVPRMHVIAERYLGGSTDLYVGEVEVGLLSAHRERVEALRSIMDCL